MKRKEEKTNVMRILEQKKAVFLSHDYTHAATTNGEEVARVLGQDPNRVFKTLVTQGASKQYHVFMVPVCRELHLKKAAAAVGEKNIAMIPQKDLLPLTGYIHGGCSPIGMKKVFHTVIDATAQSFDTIIFSAGKIGYQVELSLEELKKALVFTLQDITE
ncbi:MAG: Cys-tRNA(Pro) deacylase [Clostridia bacterium]|nr:Cys-tRNA(Pro) deacylase [Clostridia bacterium]